MVVVNGWSWEAAVALAQSFDIEACVIDGDNGADHMVRVLERADVNCHLVDAQRAAAAVSESDAVLVSTAFAGGTTLWAPIGSSQLAAAAYCAGIDVVATTPVGTRLPRGYVDAIVTLIDDDVRGETWHRDVEPVPITLVTSLVGTNGVDDAAVHAEGVAPEAPLAAELTVRSAM